MAGKRNPLATRNRIVSAAMDLFNSRSYQDLNSNDIAHHAQVSVGSFYNHFESKQSVFIACYDNWVTSEWKEIQEWLEKNTLNPDFDELISILLSQHTKAKFFRRNLNALCYVSEEMQKHRDCQRAAQSKSISIALGITEPAETKKIGLTSLLNTFEFFLDVLSNERQQDLLLTETDILFYLKSKLSKLVSQQPTTT